MFPYRYEWHQLILINRHACVGHCNAVFLIVLISTRMERRSRGVYLFDLGVLQTLVDVDQIVMIVKDLLSHLIYKRIGQIFIDI